MTSEQRSRLSQEDYSVRKLVSLNQLEAVIMDLAGAIEEMRHEIEQLREDLDALRKEKKTR